VTYEEPGEFVVPTAPDLGPVSEVEARPVDPFPTPPGLWRTVASDNGEVAVPAGAARIPGLTVVRVRIQPGPGAEVVAVDQLLESGETVRTLSGPPERVHRALAGDGEFRDSGEDGKLTVTVRQEDRMVAVTGPAGVLGTLLSTSDLRRRY
jgi:hypothetical protein